MESSSHDLPLPPFLWQPPPAPFQPRFHHAKGLVIMVFVTLFLFLVALLSVLIQRYRRRDPFGWRARSPPPTLQTHVRDVKHGLDAAVIDSFPTFLYSDVKQTSPTPRGAVAAECAVCLSEFDDEEKLRLLPRCSHVFHVACIDMWLDSHSTCPVCRAQLDGEPQPAADAAPAEADGEAWTEEERERFTLRIDPEEVRRRSRSLGRGEGSSATMGSGRAATWVGKALSERWAMLARGRPAELSKRSCGEGTSSGGGAANLV